MRCPCCGKPHLKTYAVRVQRVVRMETTVEIEAEDAADAKFAAEAALGDAHWEETSTVDQTVLRVEVMP